MMMMMMMMMIKKPTKICILFGGTKMGGVMTILSMMKSRTYFLL